MNALDPEMFDSIIRAQLALSRARGIRAVVLSGEGRAFCAGLDLASMATVGQNDPTPLTERTYGNANRFQEVSVGWRKLPMPVLALWGADGAIEEFFDCIALWRERAEQVSGRALPGGHYLAEECPNAVLREVIPFLASLTDS